MLTTEQRRAFVTDGYVIVPRVVPEPLLEAADAELDALAVDDPPPEGTVGQHFWFLPPGRLSAADAALRRSGALAIAEELVAPHRLDHALDHIQVALNIPPFPHRPGAPHIDGHRPGEPIASFTMLAAVFLSDESRPDSGNLWIWPGSHHLHQRLFVERGRPLLAHRGDLLLAHFLLGHNIGGNTSDHVRRILYYRLAASGHRARWAATFTDPLTEYAPLRATR